MLRFNDTELPEVPLRYKDAGGAPLMRGDKVLIHDVGQDCYGVIEFYPEFCTHAVRITHRLRHGGREGWVPEGGVVTSRRVLSGMARYPLTRRLKKVRLVERAKKPEVRMATNGAGSFRGCA